MTAPPISLVIFSDLDGTLLDHDTYSFAPAKPALDRCHRLGVPVVLATSKTAAEVTGLRRDMGCDQWPAIVENGAGLLSPDAAAQADPEQQTDDHAFLLERLARIDPALSQKFEGFTAAGTARVADWTGLDHPAASLARQRRFSEPGQWTGTPADRDRFVAAVEAVGISVRQGGRFLTLSLSSATKADRMGPVVAALTGHQPQAPRTLALGDAPNDVAMLEAADSAVIIPNPHAPPLPVLAGEESGKILRAGAPGPSGWNEAVLRVLIEIFGPDAG